METTVRRKHPCRRKRWKPLAGNNAWAFAAAPRWQGDAILPERGSEWRGCPSIACGQGRLHLGRLSLRGLCTETLAAFCSGKRGELHFAQTDLTSSELEKLTTYDDG